MFRYSGEIMNIFIDPLLFLQFIREATGGIFDNFFVTCSVYGELFVIVSLIAIIYWCVSKELGEYLLVSFGWADWVNGFLKIFACIYRPWIMDSRVHPVKEAIPGATGYSFPSGHTTHATSFFGGLALKGNFSKALTIVLWVCVLLVGFSRNYLGVHSVLDVIFGFLCTLAVLVIIKKLFDKLDEYPNLDLIIAAVGIIASVLLVVYAMTKSYPMDYDAAGKLIVDPAKLMLDSIQNAGLLCGISISWVVERRLINFSVDGSLKDRVLRGLCAFIGFELIVTVLVPWASTGIGRFLSAFILGLFIMVIVPFCIKYFQNRKSEIKMR